jgi:hypothetical protein
VRKLEWAAFAGVVGVVVLTQIPRHDHESMPGHGRAMDATHAAAPGMSTVTLAVSGMT